MKYLWLLMVCLLAACKSDEPLSNDSPAAAEGPARPLCGRVNETDSSTK